MANGSYKNFGKGPYKPHDKSVIINVMEHVFLSVLWKRDTVINVTINNFVVDEHFHLHIFMVWWFDGPCKLVLSVYR